MDKKKLLLAAVTGLTLILSSERAMTAPPEEDEWCTDQENEGKWKQYPLSTNSIHSCSVLNYGLVPPLVPEIQPEPIPPYSS